MIISFGIQIDFLAALWPKALRLHVESGPFSRNPYPFSLFFDHLGIYGRSIVGQAGDCLRAQPASSDLLGVAMRSAPSIHSRWMPSILSARSIFERNSIALRCSPCKSQIIIRSTSKQIIGRNSSICWMSCRLARATSV